MRDLQNRCEKVLVYICLVSLTDVFCCQVVELEIQLDEIKEQYNNVIRNSNSKAQQKKMAFLERNLEQLTLVQKQVGILVQTEGMLFFYVCEWEMVFTMCAQLVDQNSSLKKEAGIAERKLLARNERIQNLEALLQDADRRLATQNQKFEAQLQAVRERLDQARCESMYMNRTWTIKTNSAISYEACCQWWDQLRANRKAVARWRGDCASGVFSKFRFRRGIYSFAIGSCPERRGQVRIRLLCFIYSGIQILRPRFCSVHLVSSSYLIICPFSNGDSFS